MTLSGNKFFEHRVQFKNPASPPPVGVQFFLGKVSEIPACNGRKLPTQQIQKFTGNPVKCCAVHWLTPLELG